MSLIVSREILPTGLGPTAPTTWRISKQISRNGSFIQRSVQPSRPRRLYFGGNTGREGFMLNDSSDLFLDFDFSALEFDDFKEDSVREELVMPLLHNLGYGPKQPGRILRGKKLAHPFVKIGSTKRPVLTYPDYVLTVDDRPLFILDAKAPGEQIHSGPNVEQAYFYAIHPDVRARLFALCNGRDLSVFDVSEKVAILSVPLSQIASRWKEVFELLGSSRDVALPVLPAPGPIPTSEKNYLASKPPIELSQVSRQTARRHFGVHGYFTKQPWTLVHEYIRVFSQPGDLVLDPFGGGGVTLIEALMLSRRAIHVDLNPRPNSSFGV